MRPVELVRSLNPRLPRSVQLLQTGGLLNAFGNGIVYPFLFIYLHNVHGFRAGTVGLILATNGAVSLVAGPLSGTAVDRFGGRRTLAGALVVLTLGYGIVGGLIASTSPRHVERRPRGRTPTSSGIASSWP